MWLTGLVAPRHVGSSQTRARTRVPCIGRQIINHCATREARVTAFYSLHETLHALSLWQQTPRGWGSWPPLTVGKLGTDLAQLAGGRAFEELQKGHFGWGTKYKEVQTSGGEAPEVARDQLHSLRSRRRMPAQGGEGHGMMRLLLWNARRAWVWRRLPWASWGC